MLRLRKTNSETGGLSLRKGDGLASSFSVAPWNPQMLFKNGEQGAWYDPSDFSTLYQDSNGTTPVTALGQPVGLMLDKSQGAPSVRGPELVTNGTFDTSTTGWSSASGGSFSWDSGRLRLSGALGDSVFHAFQTFPTVPGRLYELKFQTFTAGSRVRVGVSNYNDTNYAFVGGASTTIAYFYATVTTSYVTLTGTVADTDFYFDNVSIREIPGNHATQSTSAARPTVQARKNLLTRTEELDISPWYTSRSTISEATEVQSPLSGSSVWLLEQATDVNSSGVIAQNTTTGVDGTWSAYLKANGKNFAIIYTRSTAFEEAWFDLQNGTVGTIVGETVSASIEDAGDGWWRCTVTNTGANSNRFAIYCADTDGSRYVQDTGGIYITAPQLELGSTATTYQRVTTATDYEDIGLPRYLEFDGVDDAMATPSVDFTGTDEVTACAGVRLESSADIVYELSPSDQAFEGVFQLYVPNSTAIRAISKGTTTVSLSNALSGFNQDYVTTLLSDISQPNLELRVDGTANTSPGSQGTGNYGNHRLYIGARELTNYELDGRIYQLIIRGKTTDGNLLSETENYVARKTGVTL